MKYGVEELKKKSDQQGVVFVDYLRQLMLEDFLYCVISIEQPICFILENDIVLREETKGNRVEQPIAFIIKSDLDMASIQLREQIMRSEDFTWRVCHETLEEDRSMLRISVEGSLEDFKIPFVVTIQERLNQPLHIDLGSYRGSLRKDALEYKVCAPEIRLSECLYMILTQLELISSMEYYDDALTIIKRFSIDGRRVADELAERTVKLEKSVLKTIEGYANYKYMEKRWISYQKNKAFKENRKCEKESASINNWEDALLQLMKFMNPIADALFKGHVFIGDWMPDLMRFM